MFYIRIGIVRIANHGGVYECAAHGFHRQHHRGGRIGDRSLWCQPEKREHGSGWRRHHRHHDVVPRLRRSAALLHGRGVGGALERLHPLAHLQARTRRGRHPGRARSGRGHARDLARRQDIQAQASVEHEVLGRHADQGLRLQLCDPTAVQDRFWRVGVLRHHRRCHRLRRRQGRHDQRHYHQRRDR